MVSPKLCTAFLYVFHYPFNRKFNFLTKETMESTVIYSEKCKTSPVSFHFSTNWVIYGVKNEYLSDIFQLILSLLFPFYPVYLSVVPCLELTLSIKIAMGLFFSKVSKKSSP